MNPVRRLLPALLVLTLTLLLAAAAWALTPGDLIKQGAESLRNGRHREALELFVRAQKLDPNSPKPHYFIASAYDRLGAADSAKVEYETAIRMDPKYVEALTGLGNLLRKQGQGTAGTEKLELAVKYDAKDAPALYSLGTAYLKDGKYDEAEKIMRKGTLLKTGRAQFLAGTALALEGKGDLKAAEELFIRARETDPNNLRVRMELGGFYERKKIPFLAVPEYKRAKEIDPKNPEYHFLYGRASVGMNEFNEGLRAYLEATTVDSTYAPAYLEAGRLFYRAKRYAEATERLTKYTQLAPDSTQGWLELGRSLSFSRDVGERSTAIGALEKAREKHRDNPELLGALCRLYAEQGADGRDSALVVCDRYAAVADTLTPEERIRIGSIYVSLGDSAKAVPLLTSAAREDSSLTRDAMFNLGFMYFTNKDYAGASPYFIQALAADSAYLPALLNLGLAKIQLGQKSEAIGYLRRAVVIKPTETRARVWIGQTLMSMGPDSLPAAYQTFRDAATADSASGDAVRGAGLALLLMDNCVDAVQWLGRGTSLEPDHVQGHVWLAQANMKPKCQNVAAAKVEFNKALELDPSNKQASEGLAIIRKYEESKKRAASGSGSKS